jgi:hypothetical protein
MDWYILRTFFPHFKEHNSLSCERLSFSLCLVFLVFQVRRNSSWRISLGIYGVSLKEGLQLGFDYAFFMICK